MDVFIAGAVFLVAYGLIASERLDRTLIALLGGLLVVVLGVIDQEEAFAAIDFNVIFLLAGMMVLAGGLSKTGFFEFIAGYAIHFSRGQPFRLLIIMSILTALLAAVLDNVTTVVLLTPVTLSIARTLKVNPFPYLISQIFASNIGGTATLIGDPPNILIGSAAGLDFGDFLVNLAPVVVIIMFAFVGIMWLAFGRNMEDDADRQDPIDNPDWPIVVLSNHDPPVSDAVGCTDPKDLALEPDGLPPGHHFGPVGSDPASAPDELTERGRLKGCTGCE
jgi:Na+/H+ antiporter NhaD/arsenite permease-like protein